MAQLALAYPLDFLNINRKTFRDSFSNHFVSVLHLLTQNKL